MGRYLNYVRILDKKMYEGNFRQGKPNGRGKIILNDGTCRYGEWENGKIKKWFDNNKE